MRYEEKIKIYQNMIRNLEIELKNYEGTPYFEDEEFKIRERINMHKDELRLYKQAAKADEYEAKAKALDRVKEFAEEPPFLLANNENADYERYAYDQILKLINKYESGDHNV